MAKLPFDLLTLAAWSRFAPLRDYAVRRLEAAEPTCVLPQPSLTILFGGDVMFDPVERRPWHLRDLGLRRGDAAPRSGAAAARAGRLVWRRVVEPLLSRDYYSPTALGGFEEFTSPAAPPTSAARHRTSQPRIHLDWSAVASDVDYPFRNVRPLFESKDLVVLNLEGPLTSDPRDQGMFKSDPRYAPAMRTAGVSVVNLANNHLFDGGEKGLLDTLRHLAEAGIAYIGVGNDLAAARAGTRIEVRGTRLLFLAYTQFCNARFASLAGTYPGLLPLARQLMVEDVRAAASTVDLVVVCVHWGNENQPAVHPRQVAIAHELIDAGAAAVIGHHPHVPHGIEVYRGRPIVYSLGNLVFAQGMNHPLWEDNFLAELQIAEGRVTALIVHPVTGRGAALFQPEPLRGAAARAFLRRLQLRSAPFRTRIAVTGESGCIALNP